MRSALLFIVAIMGCRPASPTVAHAIEGSSPEPEALSAEMSFAVFQGDAITLCTDIKASGHRHDGGAVDNADLRARMLKQFNPKNELLELPKPCGRQIGDRTIFATCGWSFTPNDAMGLTVKVHYLDFDNVFPGDAELRDCLKMKGEWISMPRTSPAFIEAQMRHENAKFERRARKLLKASGVDPSSAGLE